ncbi:MAG: zinc ribbon domain-containing protein [Candidatus Gastranaerophilales bacterium]|nr:zinc ribbon domain-containing protein [Candidatus Gastranaerophilales bacterium]
MYTNKCTKCGKEFETKNPKRVICPSCLYPDKNPILTDPNAPAAEQPQQQYRSYSAGSDNNYYKKPYNNQNQGNRRPGGFQRRPQNGGGQRPGGFQKPGGNRFNGPKRPMQKSKPLLVNKEQLAQIEELYKKMLPLPNPDAHEVIGEAIGLEAKKVFFGINLIRQKMMLPKVSFPKRKLALTPDQLMAIKNLYEPLLPLPPIGCHKILAMQLKMDEWRVHVGIGLVRKQLGLERWNQEREDAPEEYKKEAAEKNAKNTEK